MNTKLSRRKFLGFTAAGPAAASAATGARAGSPEGLIGDGIPGQHRGTDNAKRLQSLIDSFGSKRGQIRLGSGVFMLDASIDFRRCALIGEGPYRTGVGQGTALIFRRGHGLYTSVPDNQAPQHRDFLIQGLIGAKAKGQVLLNLFNQNYPRLTRVGFEGGDVGLLLSGSGKVDSHYGDFYSCDFYRCNVGIAIEGGGRTQTHHFYGGRYWRCKVAYENRHGTSDICFYGAAFESDIAIRHLTCEQPASVPYLNCNHASTYIFGGRDECKFPPDLRAGSLYVGGQHWSGSKMPTTDHYGPDGVRSLSNEVRISNVPNVQHPIYKNILKNANFSAVTPADTIVGWHVVGGVLQRVMPSSKGFAMQLKKQPDATRDEVRIYQRGLSVFAGRYRWGLHLDGSIHAAATAKLSDGGHALIQGQDFSLGASNVPFRWGDQNHTIEFLRPIANLQFELLLQKVKSTDEIFLERPYLVPFSHSELYLND